MANLNAFLGYFVSYLILFAVFVAIVVVACIVGIRWRKTKDAKAEAATLAGEAAADSADKA